MNRREELLSGATDHVLEHGLIGLSLRPLAASLGTSDRMLLYHFTSRAELVTEVIAAANERAVAALAQLPAARTPRAGVVRLWQAYRTEPLHSCHRIYVEAAASGLLGEEPYRSGVRASNVVWFAALGEYLTRCHARPARVERAARLLDAGLLGLHVELSVDSPDELDLAAKDLAEAVQALAG